MSETLTLDGPAGPLEAIWSEAASPSRCAVLAHPHPLYGGTMDNAVVRTAESVLLDLETSVLRFNFRGVGRSAGKHDGGAGEVLDLATAEQAVSERTPGLPLWLIGYSFGSVMVARRLPETTAVAATLIAPPVSHYDLSALTTTTKTLTVICGELDDIAPPAEIRARTGNWPALASLQELPGVAHDLGTAAGGQDLERALKSAFEAMTAL
ncbi:MAG: alpha/beta hydrolase [Acidobacteriota bacterium]